MSDTELVIKISGDVKNFQDALDKASKKTEDLKDALNTTAKYSAVAFAALTAEIGLSVVAFAESEAAVNKLTTAMQNQGIYSRALLENYRNQADAIQQLTGISDEETMGAMAAMQAHLGEITVTEDLTTAIADLAVAKGMTMSAAAEIMGKAVDGNTKILKQYGIEIADTGTKQENLAHIMSFVEGKWSGQAAAVTQGLGVWKLVKANFDELQESIGKKFAPAFILAGNAVNDFLKYLKNNKDIVTWITEILAFGATLTGLISVVAAAASAWIGFTTLLAAGGGFITLLMGPIGIVVLAIGGIALAVGKLAGDWKNVWPTMFAIADGFAVGLGALASGVVEVLKGMMNMSLTQIKAGWEQINNAGEEGADAYFKTLDMKNREAEQAEEEAAVKKRDKNKTREIDWAAEDKADRQKAVEELLAENEEYQALEDDQKARFREKYLEGLQQQMITDRMTRGAIADEKVQEQMKENIAYQKNLVKYGKEVAIIETALHSEKVNRLRDVSGQIVQMQNSENQTLKALGKAAAITNIVIDTARGAMAVFRGSIDAFGVPVGPIVGGVLAAATIAYGAEQIGRVTSAADGGLITGGIPGRDSVPAMLMPGEMVVPERNFNEVIDAMVMARGGQSTGVSDAASGGAFARLEISLKDEFMEFIEMKLVERQNLNISVQGT